MERVEDPEPKKELGVKVVVAPEGDPDTLNPTFPSKPLLAATFTV